MKILCLFLFFLAQFLLSKQSIVVLDKESKKPITSVNVKEKCLEGKCKDSIRILRTNKFGKTVLTFNTLTEVTISYVGYKTHKDTLKTNEERLVYLESSPVLMRDIVTTGQIVAQSAQNSIFPVKIIDRTRIEGQATNNLRDLFATQLNIQVSQDNVLGAGMSINGVSGQNVKIMIDGVPVIGRLNGNVDISQINLNNVERVEIIEGPMSTIYGTDALGGVVNIITKTSFNQQPDFRINSFYESVGNYNFDGDFTYNFTKEDRINVNGGRYFFDGYSPIDTSRFQLWKPKEQIFGDVSYVHSFDKLNFRVNSRYFFEHIWNKGQPREPYFENAFDDHYRTFRLTNSMYLEGEISNNKFINLIVSYSNFMRRKNTFLRDLVTLQDILTNSENDQDTSRFNNLLLRGTYSSDGYIENLSYQAGFDINFDDATGARIDTTGNAVRVNDYALFTSIQYKLLEELTIQPAVRFIYNTLYSAPVVPSFNLKYEISDKLKVRGSYSRGFRAPTLRELYFFFVDINHNIRGNQDLRAEFSNSYNLALSYTIQRDNSVYMLEPKFFYNDIRNQITLANVNSTLFSYVNLGRFQTVGGELQLKYLLDGFNFNLGLNYIGRNSILSDTLPSLGFRYTPEVSLNINYDVSLIDAKFNIFYKYFGKQPGYSVDFDGKLSEFTIDSYNMMDASLSREFLDKKLNLQLGVRNLFDVRNVNNGGGASGGVHSSGSNFMTVGYGRTLFTSLKVNL